MYNNDTGRTITYHYDWNLPITKLQHVVISNDRSDWTERFVEQYILNWIDSCNLSARSGIDIDWTIFDIVIVDTQLLIIIRCISELVYWNIIEYVTYIYIYILN